jgi:hypothetical protein
VLTSITLMFSVLTSITLVFSVLTSITLVFNYSCLLSLSYPNLFKMSPIPSLYSLIVCIVPLCLNLLYWNLFLLYFIPLCFPNFLSPVSAAFSFVLLTFLPCSCTSLCFIYLEYVLLWLSVSTFHLPSFHAHCQNFPFHEHLLPLSNFCPQFCLLWATYYYSSQPIYSSIVIDWLIDCIALINAGLRQSSRQGRELWPSDRWRVIIG